MGGSEKISVVMSVYNGERYVSAAIDSVRRQTWRDWELIVVDDGSTDQSPNILAQYATSDRRIRLVRQTNRGLTCALNEGIRLATGRFVARMDADDVAEPKRLSEQWTFLHHNHPIVAVGSALTLIDPDGELLEVRRYPESHFEIDERLMQGDGVIPHPSAMFRRDVWLQCGGYREKFTYAQDLDLWLRFAEVGRLANLVQPLLRYRLHGEALSALARLEQLNCACQAVSDARARRGLAGHDLDLRQHARRPTPAKQLRSWSRMALRSGNLGTARKHARAALREAPFSPSNLGLAARIFLQSMAHDGH